MDLGPVMRWMNGDIYVAENDFVRLAWAATDDPEQVGKFGWHGPQQIGVEYISREQAKEFDKKWSEGP